MKKIKNSIFIIIILIFIMLIIPSLFFNDDLRNIYNNIALFIIGPIFIFLSCYIHDKKSQLNWHLPIILSLVISSLYYLFINKNIASLNILIMIVSGYFANFIYFFYTQKKCRKENVSNKLELKIKHKYKVVLSIVIMMFLLFILEIYYRMCTFDTLAFNLNGGFLIMNIVLLCGIYVFLLSFLGSTYKTNITLSCILFILFFANQMRIFYTGDTLLLSDFLFLQNTGEIGGFINVTFINAIGYLLLPTLLIIIIMVWLINISYYCDIKISKTNTKFSLFLLSLSSFSILFIPLSNIDKSILNNMYNRNNLNDYILPVSNTYYYQKFGVISGMYGKMLEARHYPPDNYNSTEVDTVMKDIDEHKATWGQPNIIVVFSESFWDISRLKGIEFEEDVLPNFHSLKDKGKYFEMISPSYGGVSANVEWQFLTGGSLNYFSKGYIPYMQHYNSNKASTYPSIIKELNNNNYKTEIVNSSSNGMFNCDNVYKKMSVKEIHHLYDELKLDKGYVTDEYLTNMLKDQFDKKKNNEKLFYMMITMGGHMPYYYERYKEYDVSIKNSMYSNDINEVVLSYAQGIHYADKELGRLYDYINSLKEDTILIFYGDHLPILQTNNGKDILYDTGYLNKSYDIDSVYKQFNTQALILSNYDIKHTDMDYISPDLLLTYVINNMNINLSDYYKYLYSTLDAMPSSNSVISIDKYGSKYYTLDSSKRSNTYDLRKKIQYKYFH